MDRRTFLSATSAAVIESNPSVVFRFTPRRNPRQSSPWRSAFSSVPMARRMLRLRGFTTSDSATAFFLSTATSATSLQLRPPRSRICWTNIEVTATTVEVVGPPPLEWNFLRGPATIGLVPPATRAARIDALRQVSDFAKLVGISQVQTHCGFIPEDPDDALYPGTVEAIRTVAQHCHDNGQYFLMETGQETPTTMSRVIRDVGMPNLGVGLDTANLILYGKANPVDAVDILGPHVRSIHAKDGRWPTDPSQLGEEVLIGKGLVDFRAVFTKLHRLGYTGAVTIERETSGPQQIEDVRQEKLYLEKILKEVLA